jgi:hypothetical protein
MTEPSRCRLLAVETLTLHGTRDVWRKVDIMCTDRMKVDVELSAQDAWALLRHARLGRLALIVDGHPDVFPVNHMVDLGTVVFRTAAGTKLAGAVGRTVAFEVDGYDVGTASAWSVVLKGTAQAVTRRYELLDVSELPLFPWHSAPKPHFIRIEPDSITGRLFEVTGNARSAEPVGPIRHGSDE